MENRIFVLDENGNVKAGLVGTDEVVLTWKGEYELGDVIVMEFVILNERLGIEMNTPVGLAVGSNPGGAGFFCEGHRAHVRKDHRWCMCGHDTVLPMDRAYSGSCIWNFLICRI